jgi:hypothetical protein
MTATRSISAESIVASHAEALALPVILSGVLDAKIAECKAAMAALDARQQVTATLEEAAKIKADAETAAAALLAQAKVDANTVTVTAKQAADDAAMRQAKVTAAEQANATERERLANVKLTLEVQANALNTREASLVALGQQLDIRRNTQDKAEAKLKADTAALNASLDALKRPI